MASPATDTDHQEQDGTGRQQPEPGAPKPAPESTSNGSDAGATDGESNDSEGGRSAQLIRLVRSAAGRDLFVSSVAADVLDRSNWGSLLGAAPDALGRLAQCFVLVSDPLAASLEIPKRAGLEYKSLRANLTRCSQLGMKTFREAEARMRKVLAVTKAICEPSGTIDLILESVDNDILAELSLPDQLQLLRNCSQRCVEDTKAINLAVTEWSNYAKSIYSACVDKEDDLGNQKNNLDDQAGLQETSVEMKKNQVNMGKAQTAEYRSQLTARQREYVNAEDELENGHWKDFLHDAATGLVDLGMKAVMGPIGFVVGSFRSNDKDDGHYITSPSRSAGSGPKADDAHQLASELLHLVQMLRGLLVQGSDEYGGVNWDALSGGSRRPESIRYIIARMQGLRSDCAKKNSAMLFKVHTEAGPAEEVALEIRAVLVQDSNIGSDTPKKVAARAADWRSRAMSADVAISKIIQADLEAAEQREKERKDEKKESIRLSRRALRFERFRMAQQALFEAESRLNARLEEELKATQEFDAMQLELDRLLRSKATVVEIKKILGECTRHLQQFCEKLERLSQFFTLVYHHVDAMDQVRLRAFVAEATTTKALGDRLVEAQARGGSRIKDYETLKQRKFEELKLRALELKGYYLVAHAMADTYVEVSGKHITPGVETVDRLSLSDERQISKEERANKVAEVGRSAAEAKTAVTKLANARKREMIKLMSITDAGEAIDVEE
ncbi:hypothetical protein MFIFM68171_06543 [Madurella fahalii]|uniref:Uncharacterized protein n=1 Tax=Madurella fahalii TaxID=1157608 RepID=A0ABQ0GEZ5_9PEZI